jgi:hypothetical protein
MAKQKVIVECTVKYLIGGKDEVWDRGYFNRSEKHELVVDIKSKKNSGGEAWDWAQAHWDEFLVDDGPDVIVDGTTFKTHLRWCCVTGVTDLKGKYLPIEQKKWSESKAPQSRHKEKTEKKSSYPGGKNSSDKRKDNPTKPKTQPKSKSSGKKVVSFEEMKAKKIAEAMEKDD